ncbi:MAG: hypothetical protein SFV17_07205 [Candidatus Obscuribacter sp.]|nr:hypothetical protein [Candidatus Obscuribacter sp.]
MIHGGCTRNDELDLPPCPRDMVGCGLSDLWRFDPDSGGWCQPGPVLSPDGSPYVARGHGIVNDADERLIFFGGMRYDSNLKPETLDLVFSFVPDTRQSRKIAVLPEGLSAFAYCYDRTNQVVYLHGGLDSTFKAKSSLWKIHLLSGEISLLSSTGPARFSHALALFEDSLWLLDGCSGVPVNQADFPPGLWRFSLAEGLWTQTDFQSPHRHPRYGAAYAIKGPCLYSFGGFFPAERTDNGHMGLSFDELWRLNLASLTGSKLNQQSIPAREMATMNFLGDELVLFGGYSHGTFFCDTHSLVL